MAAGAAFMGGKDIAVSLYLALRLMTNCDVNRGKPRAAHQDVRQITIPVPVVASALPSLPAMGELERTTRQPALRAAVTILLSWAFTHTIFAPRLNAPATMRRRANSCPTW